MTEMNMKAAIDEQGFVLGFYLDDMPHPEGAVMVVVSPQEHAALIEYPRGHFYDGSAWVEAPDPVVTPESLLASLPPVSRVQMLAALVDFEIITEAEALSWVLGVLPDAVNNVISTMPTNQQLTAKLQALLPTDVHTDNKLVIALAQEKDMGLEALIMLFEHAASKV